VSPEVKAAIIAAAVSLFIWWVGERTPPLEFKFMVYPPPSQYESEYVVDPEGQPARNADLFLKKTVQISNRAVLRVGGTTFVWEQARTEIIEEAP